jgi:hypothetical protein
MYLCIRRMHNRWFRGSCAAPYVMPSVDSLPINVAGDDSPDASFVQCKGTRLRTHQLYILWSTQHQEDVIHYDTLQTTTEYYGVLQSTL